MKKKNRVIVCPSPGLIHTLDLKDKIVVVIDILRATTSMCVAFQNGAEAIIPVESVDECLSYQKEGKYICAAERDGEVVKGFQIGNSPFSYMTPDINGSTIVMTTTNGTKSIHCSKDAHEIVIGSFSNWSILREYLYQQNRDIILLCAGWKDKLNLEDTVFAGALADSLKDHLQPHDDSTMIAINLYKAANKDKLFYIKNSTHCERLVKLNMQEDVKYCLKKDLNPVLPVFKGDRLVNVKL